MNKLLTVLALLVASASSAQVMYEKSTPSPVQYVSCTNNFVKDDPMLAKAFANGGGIVLVGNCQVAALKTMISGTNFNGNGYTVTAAAAANWSGGVIGRFIQAAASATKLGVENTNFDWSGGSPSNHVLHFGQPDGTQGNSEVSISNNTAIAPGDFISIISGTDVTEIGNKCYQPTGSSSYGACFDHWGVVGRVKSIGNTAVIRNQGFGFIYSGFIVTGTIATNYDVSHNTVEIAAYGTTDALGIYVQGYAGSCTGAESFYENVGDNQIIVDSGIEAGAIRVDGCSGYVDVHDNTITSDGATQMVRPAIEATGTTLGVQIHNNQVFNWLGATAGNDRGVFNNRGAGGSLLFNQAYGTISGPLDYVASVTTIQQIGDDTGTGSLNLVFTDLLAGATNQIGWTGRGVMTSPGTNQVQIGPVNSATPADQSVLTQGARAATDTDTGGASLTIQSGTGTGSGTGSTLTLKTPQVGSTGTTLQTQVTALQLGYNQIFFGNATSNPAYTFRGSGAISGTPVTSLFASPPAIGGTSAATGAFTTLSATSTVSGAGFSTYLASPPAIGGSAAAAGSFTTLSSTGLHTASGGITSTGADANINASSNFNTNINTGTSTGTATIGQNSSTPSAIALLGPVSFKAGTAFSGASWATTSPVWDNAAETLNDTSASGTITTEAAHSFQAPNFTSTGGASTTITNATNVWLAAPTCSGGVVCTNLYSLFTAGKIISAGLVQGGAGSNFNGGTINLNSSSNFTVAIGNGTNNTTTTIGGTTAGNIVNIASVKTEYAGVMYESSTAPTISGHFNTSSDTVTGTNTAAFQVTVGTGTGTSTGSVTMPTATTGWACSVADVTTPATNLVQQTGSTTTLVTVTNYVRTTGVAGNFTNSDKLVFHCGAF